MTHNVSAPRADDDEQQRLQELLFDLGPRKLVLVEGLDDASVYAELFQEHLGEVFFHDCGGGPAAETEFRKLLALSSRKQVFVILDRDFRESAEVDDWRKDESARRFVLRYYAMENYLLHPAAVWGALRGLLAARFPVGAPAQMADEMKQLCNDLVPVMAINWLLKEGQSGETYFKKGDERIGDRKAIIQAGAEKLKCAPEEVEQRMRSKEAHLQSALNDLDDAYRYINGKHLLFRLWQRFITKGVQEQFLRNLLVQRVREGKLLAPDLDLRQILDRVLGPNPP